MLSLLILGGVLILVAMICVESFISWSYLQWRCDASELGRDF
jgi:hypothetical protein